jgi:hypothetical protein
MMQEHEIVSANDNENDDSKAISGGFMGVRSTEKTRGFFRKYANKYTQHLASFHDHQDDIGNDGEQHTLTPLLRESDIRVHWLSQCESANGMWYRRRPDPKCPIPMVIQNNWIVGSAAKKKRAMKYEQWFLDDNGQCSFGGGLRK